MKDAFENYKIALQYIQSVYPIQNASVNDDKSDYWKEEVDMLDYMLDATPRIINRLRHHCHLITGIRPYEYRSNREGINYVYREEIERLNKLGCSDLLIPENRMLGGFGHEIDGELYNYDTLKYYRCLITLKLTGVLEAIKEVDNKTIVEIGAGWGGFAYQFKKIMPDSRYIIVDLPEVLLFSMTYLMTTYPDSKIIMYNKGDNERLVNESYDFAFIPSTLFRYVEQLEPFLAVNIVSFQEMTSVQVGTYLQKLADMDTKILYSMNRDRQQSNNQLGNLRSVIDKYYTTFEFHFPEQNDKSKIKSTYSHKHLLATKDAKYKEMFKEKINKPSSVNSSKDRAFGDIKVLIICDDNGKSLFRILDDINRVPDESINITVIVPNDSQDMLVGNLHDYSNCFTNVCILPVDHDYVVESNMNSKLLPYVKDKHCSGTKHLFVLQTSKNDHAVWARPMFKRLGKFELSGNFVYHEIRQ